MAKMKPFQLLEITIISAQDLEPVSKKIKTYATAWIHANRKLSTRVDTDGNSNPTWNDKFVFRVNEEFLRCDTSAVMIEIYSAHWFRDNLVGTVRVLVGNLIPPAHRSQYHHNQHLGMRFVALQVRRPSGRPQGILNIGVAVLDSSMRSMPLYTQMNASAVGFRDLMEDESYYDHIHQNKNNNADKNKSVAPIVKPILRRSRSERSERIIFDGLSATNTSMVAIPQRNGSTAVGSSILSVLEFEGPIKGKGKSGKASSVISGAELREKPKEKGKKGKASSLISASVASKDLRKNELTNESPILMVKDVNNKVSNVKLGSELGDPHTKKIVDEKLVTKNPGLPVPPQKVVQGPVIGKPISKFNGYEYGGQRVTDGKFIFGPPHKGNSIWSDSEVGPSPSEVAAAMVERRYPLEDEQSSVLDGWSVDESVEGLRSKLERWRTELPPIYDRRLSSSTFQSSQHARRHTDGGSGLFSCFGNIYGYECQCICGKPTRGRGRGSGSRFRSPSVGSVGRSF